jgi:sulfate/thiosulfate-binding protein
MTRLLSFAAAAVVATLVVGCSDNASPTTAPATQASTTGAVELLNVSYDPTRELYEDFNGVFAKHWQETAGQAVKVSMSHGGSGKQARAVIDGLAADVVTLALADDIDQIASRAKLLPEDWQKRLADNSSPYTSTIVLVVRKGNPKGIKDWADVAKEGVSMVAANPKTGGGARWNYLAAYGAILKRELGDLKKLKDPAAAEDVKKAHATAQDVVGRIYRNAAALDSGARGVLTSFAQRKLGDVLIGWENEALLAQKEWPNEGFEIVVPSASILAEPTVAVVDQVAEQKGTKAVAEAYLKYLYEPAGQEVAAKHFYRPRNAEVLAKYASTYKQVDLFTIDDVFGGWKAAQKEYFADGGVYDREQAKRK